MYGYGSEILDSRPHRGPPPQFYCSMRRTVQPLIITITTLAVVFTRYATVLPLSELINFFQRHAHSLTTPIYGAFASSFRGYQFFFLARAHLRVTPLPLIATSSLGNSDSSLTENSL